MACNDIVQNLIDVNDSQERSLSLRLNAPLFRRSLQDVNVNFLGETREGVPGNRSSSYQESIREQNYKGDLRGCCFPSVVIENCHSNAQMRNHMAAERTWSAGIRTGLSLVGIGIALSNLAHKTPGYSLVLIGCVFMFLSTRRYVKCTKNMLKNRFEVNTGDAAWTMLLINSLIVLAIILNELDINLFGRGQ